MTSQLYLIPQWFFGYGIALELIFAAITFIVAVYAFKMYKLSYEKSCQVLGAGFLLISAAYATWSLVNIYFFLTLRNLGYVSLDEITSLGVFGVYAYVIFSILGLTTLVYLTLKTKSYRVFSTIATLSLLVFIFAAQKALAFYFVSSFLILLVFIHYFKEYSRGKKKSTFLLMIAFLFLLISNLDFTLATIQDVHYVVGHVLSLFAYILIFSSFIMTLRAARGNG